MKTYRGFFILFLLVFVFVTVAATCDDTGNPDSVGRRVDKKARDIVDSVPDAVDTVGDSISCLAEGEGGVMARSMNCHND